MNLNEHIEIEAGHFVFNCQNGTETMTLRADEAGRAAKGLRLALEGKVDMANLRVVSEGEPTLAYRYDKRQRLMVEETLTPDLVTGKMVWRATGNPDPGYRDQNGANRHQITSHYAALLFLRGTRIQVPVTDWNQNAVSVQIALAATPEAEREGAYERLASAAAFAGAW